MQINISVPFLNFWPFFFRLLNPVFTKNTLPGSNRNFDAFS